MPCLWAESWSCLRRPRTTRSRWSAGTDPARIPCPWSCTCGRTCGWPRCCLRNRILLHSAFGHTLMEDGVVSSSRIENQFTKQKLCLEVWIWLAFGWAIEGDLCAADLWTPFLNYRRDDCNCVVKICLGPFLDLVSALYFTTTSLSVLEEPSQADLLAASMRSWKGTVVLLI